MYLRDCEGDVNDHLENELSIVHDAIFTEPDDQSAWWYYQFLMDWGEKEILEEPPDAIATSRFRNILQQQIETLRSLLDLEIDSKWAMVTLTSLLHMEIKSRQRGAGDKYKSDVKSLAEERGSLLRRLCELDQSHKKRYMYLLSL